MLRVLARDGRPGDRAALPQRVWAADAARHALRRGRGDLRQRAGGGGVAAGVRGWSAAAGFCSCSRRRARERDRVDVRGAARRGFQCRQRDAADRRRDGRSAGRRGRPGCAATAGDGRVQARRRAARVRVGGAGGARARFQGGEDFREGMAEFARAPLRAAYSDARGGGGMAMSLGSVRSGSGAASSAAADAAWSAAAWTA